MSRSARGPPGHRRPCAKHSPRTLPDAGQGRCRAYRSPAGWRPASVRLVQAQVDWKVGVSLKGLDTMRIKERGAQVSRVRRKTDRISQSPCGCECRQPGLRPSREHREKCAKRRLKGEKL